ncbi:MAG: DUF3881 family protein [Lachnospiraceae bacterium]|nr:DUF3881 family protein [Lachnospiraceae bacterium]
MNRYFRAVGFLNNFSIQEYEKIVEDIIFRPEGSIIADNINAKYLILDKNLDCGENIGICARIIKDSKGNIHRDTVFPYFRNDEFVEHEYCSFEKKISGEEFLGVYEDLNLGENIFFYVQNVDELFKKKNLKTIKCSVAISGLSIAGNVILPIKKNEAQIEDAKEFNKKRINLLNKANDGDHNAFATVRYDDILTNVTVSEQVFVESMDIYTVVDSSFIPCGAECDLYSVLGEIVDFKTVKNVVSDENVYVLKVLVKGVVLTICINEKDLFGEPQIGFRFKGTVWLQGRVNIP